jgi:hypothetical protein
MYEKERAPTATFTHFHFFQTKDIFLLKKTNTTDTLKEWCCEICKRLMNNSHIPTALILKLFFLLCTVWTKALFVKQTKRSTWITLKKYVFFSYIDCAPDALLYKLVPLLYFFHFYYFWLHNTLHKETLHCYLTMLLKKDA